MTDTSETPTPTPQYGVSDEVTVSRGKLRGQTGKVGMVGATAYGVKFADGTIEMINFGNVKDRVEPTITATQLAQAFGDEGPTINEVTITRLERLVPGITENITRAVVRQDSAS